jgi:hypothetical protein
MALSGLDPVERGAEAEDAGGAGGGPLLACRDRTPLLEPGPEPLDQVAVLGTKSGQATASSLRLVGIAGLALRERTRSRKAPELWPRSRTTQSGTDGSRSSSAIGSSCTWPGAAARAAARPAPSATQAFEAAARVAERLPSVASRRATPFGRARGLVVRPDRGAVEEGHAEPAAAPAPARGGESGRPAATGGSTAVRPAPTGRARPGWPATSRRSGAAGRLLRRRGGDRAVRPRPWPAPPRPAAPKPPPARPRTPPPPAAPAACAGGEGSPQTLTDSVCGTRGETQACQVPASSALPTSRSSPASRRRRVRVRRPDTRCLAAEKDGAQHVGPGTAARCDTRQARVPALLRSCPPAGSRRVSFPARPRGRG